MILLGNTVQVPKLGTIYLNILPKLQNKMYVVVCVCNAMYLKSKIRFRDDDHDACS